MPFLTEVKTKFDQTFKDGLESISQAESEEDFEEAITALKRSLWKIAEEACKESYTNGRKGKKEWNNPLKGRT